MGQKILPAIADRWKSRLVLKRDIFSAVERGWFITPTGEVEGVIRHLDQVPWWSRPIARFLLSNERRALQHLDQRGLMGVAPSLLFSEKSLLVRGWIDGVPLYIAQPYGDLAYFRSAKVALRKLHRIGICHNDLAKEQNWLRGRDRRAYLTDFQLAIRFSRRSRMFRIAAYEDLRHLLKHKRRYAESALTASERRILAHKSWPTRIWTSTGKKIYIWITRGIFRFADREGSGLRLIQDAPSIEKHLKNYPGVREIAVVAYPDRRAGTGLYAFVEAAPSLSEHALLDFIVEKLGSKIAPEHLQLVEAMPRRTTGEVHTEILQLIALNQIDIIDPLITSEAERSAVARITCNRRNLGDRIEGLGISGHS
jgi:predicted Ser/Thr protein kinase